MILGAALLSACGGGSSTQASSAVAGKVDLSGLNSAPAVVAGGAYSPAVGGATAQALVVNLALNQFTLDTDPYEQTEEDLDSLAGAAGAENAWPSKRILAVADTTPRIDGTDPSGGTGASGSDPVTTPADPGSSSTSGSGSTSDGTTTPGSGSSTGSLPGPDTSTGSGQAGTGTQPGAGGLQAGGDDPAGGGAAGGNPAGGNQAGDTVLEPGITARCESGLCTVACEAGQSPPEQQYRHHPSDPTLGVVGVHPVLLARPRHGNQGADTSVAVAEALCRSWYAKPSPKVSFRRLGDAPNPYRAASGSSFPGE